MPNNNLPLFAEEQTQLINEEQLAIQEILSQFKQPIPNGFVELGQPKKYWGSTEGLDKPLCERYTFKYNNKSYTLDIDQELSSNLELTSKDNFHIKKEILSRSPEEGGITIKNEKEIFLPKPFTIQNLEKDINKLFDLIEKLKEEKGEDQGTIANLTTERDDYQSKYDGVEEELSQKQEIIRSYLQRIKELEREKEQELSQKDKEIARLRNKIREVEIERNNRPTQQQLDNLRKELERKSQELHRELSWWDKWSNDRELLYQKNIKSKITPGISVAFMPRKDGTISTFILYDWENFKIHAGDDSMVYGSLTNFIKDLFKKIYEHYRNQ